MAKVYDATFEAYISSFEDALSREQNPCIRDYLPPQTHDSYHRITAEMIRVFLEWSWDRGQRPRISDFQDDFADVFACDQLRSEIAFEEYRLRQLAGDEPCADAYASDFKIDTSSWRRWSGYDAVPAEANKQTEPAWNGDTDGRGRIQALSSIRFESGDAWKGFEIVRQLGKGSFARTYLARQQALANRPVVLKFSHLDTAEADKLARLQHTNIMPVFSVHSHHGNAVLCMPFLGATTLEEAITAFNQDALHQRSDKHGTAFVKLLEQQGKTVDNPSAAMAENSESRAFLTTNSFENSCLWIASLLAGGLEHAHRRGIIHRDVKPANILLGQDAQPLLIDFNLARRHDDASSDFAGGTLAYMAPEQIAGWLNENESLNNSEEDASVDIYGLGVVLFQLLTGRLPFNAVYSRADGEQLSRQQRIEQLITQKKQVVELRAVLPEASPAAASILRKCLAPTPRERYKSAAALREDILSHLHDLPLRYAANDSTTERLRKWTRRHPRIVSWSTAMSALAAGCLIMAISWQARSEQMATIEAKNSLVNIERSFEALRPSLFAVGLDDPQEEQAREAATRLAYQHDLVGGPEQTPYFHRLDTVEKTRLGEAAKSLCFLVAKSLAYAADSSSSKTDQQTLFDDALRWCDAAVLWNGGETSGVLGAQRKQIEIGQARIDGGRTFEAGADAAINSAKLANADATDEMEYLDLLILGIQSLEDGHPDKAITMFRTATQRAPHEPACWLRLADGLRTQHKYDEAIACFDVCQTLLPTWEFVPFQRGVCRLEKGEFRKAIRDFTIALELRPGFANTMLNRAIANHSLGRPLQALRDLDRVVSAPSRDPRSFLLRSRVLLQLGRKEAALDDLRRARTLQPDDASGWNELGLAELAAEPKLALQHFQQALELDPDFPNALHNVAHVLSAHLGNDEQAIESLDRALAIDPDDLFARAGRAVLLARLGHDRRALDDASYLLQQKINPLTRYQAACVFALAATRQPDLAPLAVAQFTASAFEDPAIIQIAETDPDFASVVNTEGFRVARDSLTARASDAEPMTPTTLNGNTP